MVILRFTVGLRRKMVANRASPFFFFLLIVHLDFLSLLLHFPSSCSPTLFSFFFLLYRPFLPSPSRAYLLQVWSLVRLI